MDLARTLALLTERRCEAVIRKTRPKAPDMQRSEVEQFRGSGIRQVLLAHRRTMRLHRNNESAGNRRFRRVAISLDRSRCFLRHVDLG